MPGYGLASADEGELLPWEWALERLASSRNYWVGTVRADGRPHSMPVWGVMLGDLLCFSTSRESVKVRNIKRDPRCTVTTERADEAVIIEGIVSVIEDADLVERFIVAYATKYAFRLTREMGPFYMVEPKVAFGFIEAEAQFGRTATRWRFGNG